MEMVLRKVTNTSPCSRGTFGLAGATKAGEHRCRWNQLAGVVVSEDERMAACSLQGQMQRRGHVCTPPASSHTQHWCLSLGWYCPAIAMCKTCARCRTSSSCICTRPALCEGGHAQAHVGRPLQMRRLFCAARLGKRGQCFSKSRCARMKRSILALLRPYSTAAVLCAPLSPLWSPFSHSWS